MAAPRRVFVKIRDFSQDSAAVRPKPPVEPRPRTMLKLADLRPSSRKALMLPSINKAERNVPVRRICVKSESPSRMEDIRVLNYEEVCHPYELDEGPRVDQRMGERKGSFAQRIDLRRGSFSKKQIVSPRKQVLVLSHPSPPPQRQYSKPAIHAEVIVRPPSPQTENRSTRMKQISKRYLISREALETKHRAALSEPNPEKPPKPEKSLSVEPRPPQEEWLSSLGEVTNVRDFTLKVKPAFVPRRRVKLTK